MPTNVIILERDSAHRSWPIFSRDPILVQASTPRASTGFCSHEPISNAALTKQVISRYKRKYMQRSRPEAVIYIEVQRSKVVIERLALDPEAPDNHARAPQHPCLSAWGFESIRCRFLRCSHQARGQITCSSAAVAHLLMEKAVSKCSIKSMRLAGPLATQHEDRRVPNCRFAKSCRGSTKPRPGDARVTTMSSNAIKAGSLGGDSVSI